MGDKFAYFVRGVAKVESYEKRLIFQWFFKGLVTYAKKLQNRCSEDKGFKVAQMLGAKCAYFLRGVAKVESYEKRLIFHWLF